MTHKIGRLGRRFARSDPRGHWGAGVPASAGFMPEQPVILERTGHTFAQTSADDVDVSRVAVAGGLASQDRSRIYGSKYDACGEDVIYQTLNEEGEVDPNSTSGNYRCWVCDNGDAKIFSGHVRCVDPGGDEKKYMGDPRLISEHIAERELTTAPELSKAPPKCRDPLAWTKSISENSSYKGYRVFQSIVRFPSLSSTLPMSVQGVQYDIEGNLGYNKQAERQWRKRLRDLAQNTREAAGKSHPAVRAQIYEYAARAKAALIRIGKIYDDPGKVVPSGRRKIRGLYLRAVQLLWCALYQRAISESFYKNKTRKKRQVHTAKIVLPTKFRYRKPTRTKVKETTRHGAQRTRRARRSRTRKRRR